MTTNRALVTAGKKPGDDHKSKSAKPKQGFNPRKDNVPFQQLAKRRKEGQDQQDRQQ